MYISNARARTYNTPKKRQKNDPKTKNQYPSIEKKTTFFFADRSPNVYIARLLYVSDKFLPLPNGDRN